MKLSLKFPPELVHAKIADTMLKTALHLPIYLELYFDKGIPEIIHISLNLVNNVSLDAVPDRVKHLSTLLSQNPIIEAEFPILCHLCYCKLNFTGLPKSQQAKMISLQHSTIEKLAAKMNDKNRFQKLVNLSHEFVNVFYAYL